MSATRVALVAAVAGFAGVFCGQYAWQAFAEKRAAAQAEAARAADLAFQKGPVARQRRAVQRKLSDPNSARFIDERASPTHPGVWCGSVNANNRIGAMTGFRPYVVDVTTADERLDSAFIDGDEADRVGGIDVGMPVDEFCGR